MKPDYKQIILILVAAVILGTAYGLLIRYGYLPAIEMKYAWIV